MIREIIETSRNLIKSIDRWMSQSITKIIFPDDIEQARVKLKSLLESGMNVEEELNKEYERGKKEATKEACNEYQKELVQLRELLKSLKKKTAEKSADLIDIEKSVESFRKRLEND